MVDTDTARRFVLADPAVKATVARAMPQPLGFPGPVAAVDTTAWMTSADNAFMTGQIVFVDGGAEVPLRGESPYMHRVRQSALTRLRLALDYLRTRLRAPA